MMDINDQPPVLGLASDFGSASTDEEIRIFIEQYYDIIRNLGIHHFFEPAEKNITLSAEVDVTRVKIYKNLFKG
jgi:hypothetical protein